MEELETVCDVVWSAGQAFGIIDFGVYAVNSLRLEEAYAGWGAEPTNEITMIEAGMERFVKLDKGDFVGREAMSQHKQEEMDARMVHVEVTVEEADVRGGEPVFAGESVIGVTTSGEYGHRVEKSLAFAYEEPSFAAPESTFDIEILGKRCREKVLAEPLYDPKNDRLRS